MAVAASSPLQTDSSASELSDTAEFDFSALGDATPDEDSTSSDKRIEEKICPVCDKPIVRDPSWKRMRKYHDECRPSPVGVVRDSIAGTSTRGNARKEKEADECVVMIRKRLVQGCMFVMMADQYDGFVCMTAIPGICENVRGVLIAHDEWRKDVLRMKSGGSLIGLVFSIALPVAAILAHHSLIPSARLSEMLVNLPKIMFKIQQRLKEGEKATEEMMTRIGEQFLKEDMERRSPNGTNPTSQPFDRTAAFNGSSP